ncbi:MAG: hypothetical protein IJ652_05085 [Bacteroidales bacterium]|nr:hypothetical protein [Bacteroidales bacterium]
MASKKTEEPFVDMAYEMAKRVDLSDFDKAADEIRGIKKNVRVELVITKEMYNEIKLMQMRLWEQNNERVSIGEIIRRALAKFIQDLEE